MNIYKSIGLDWLLDKTVWEKLNKHISQNTRYVVPGYKYNYRLCTFPGDVEFQRCETLDGTIVKTDMHICGREYWKLEACDELAADSAEHFYSFKIKNGEIIPIRIVCSDVLPSINKGDVLKGQVVAFADKITKSDDKAVSNGNVTNIGGNCVNINGVVSRVVRSFFEFDNKKCNFWEINLETVNGYITAVVAMDNIDFTPEHGDVVSVDAMISMDVAVEEWNQKDVEPYTNLIPDADKVKYRNGFLTGFHRDQKTFIKSIETGDMVRFTRCLAKSVGFVGNRDETDNVCFIDKYGIIHELVKSLPDRVEKAEVKHLLSCKNKKRVGHDAICVYSDNEVKLVIWFDVDKNGMINQIELFNADECSLGIDYELHLHAMFTHASCNRKWYILSEYLDEGCMYRSEYADVCLVGGEYIIERFADIDGKLDNSNLYTYELSCAKDELRFTDDLPSIYQNETCTVTYQGGNLAYVTFLQTNEENKITNILLSCDPQYLKRFEAENVDNKHKSVKEIISEVYGKEDTVNSMRQKKIPESDENDVYVWKKADEFAMEWLRDNGYKVSETVLIDDCIGYACERRGYPYAVFFYAYGEERTTQLDGEYCSKLRNEEIAQGREIIIIYLHVEKKTGRDGEVEYNVGAYGDTDSKIEPWLLTEVKGKNILRYYPSKEMMDMISRFIAAFNSKNLDILEVLCSRQVFMETFIHEGRNVNHGVYTHLASIRRNHGKMKIAYVRFRDVVFSAVPYIDNYGYLSFTVNNENNIDSINVNPLKGFRELLITDEEIDYCPENDVPDILTVEFMKPSEVSRFSLRLTFENGEVKRYDLPTNFCGDEVENFQGRVMTDKIFANGRLVSRLPIGENNYPSRGQGIEFISGSTISTIEMYYGSYPVEKFSYAGMDNVNIMQMDYAEDGFGVGYISGLDPQNPTYLFDRNTMTATVLPDEYQKTPIGIYPFYGGYSEGLVMVSKLGKIELQYHHNFGPCAGLWGWLDKEMNVVIEPEYVYAMNFVNGRATVCKGEWDIRTNELGEKEYWCNNEQWGVIDKSGTEIVPCRFDEIYEVDNTDRLYLVHEGGWENGHYAIFDTEIQENIFVLDFEFDLGYMFNECFVADNDILVFDKHLPGEKKDLIYAYDLVNKQYIAHGEQLEGRTFNGETKSVVNKDGKDIIIF